MARDFNGVNEQIVLGSDVSIDAFALRSVAFWYQSDSGTSYAILFGKDGPATNSGFGISRDFNLTRLTITHTFGAGATEARWNVTGSDPGTALHHVVITYDNGNVANNPLCYIDGVSVAVTVATAPSGTADSDAAKDLYVGQGADGGGDFDGRLAHLSYDNTIWDAAMVNRHRWWGTAPGGPSTVKVWHPWWTAELNNKGTATANGTATGTRVDNASVPKVERMWGSLMGCGR